MDGQIEEWFQLYGDDIYNFLVYFNQSRDVEDMVQETFIRAIKGLENYKGKSSPKVRLCSIARNVAIDFSRKYRRMSVSEIAVEQLISKEMTPEEVVVMSDTTNTVLKLLRDFNPKYRDVFLLRSIYGLSSAETASILGWTQTRVNVTYHRAKRMVKERVNPQIEGGMAK